MESKDEVVQVIKNNVPSYQTEKLVKLYMSDADENDYYNLAKKFLGENTDNGSWIATGTSSFGVEKKSFFTCLKNEVYLLFCSDDEKYAEYRKKIDSTIDKAVGAAVVAIATTLNISTGLIAGAVTCLVLCIYKLTKNAWCEANKPLTPSEG
jgi:hypothetical protein